MLQTYSIASNIFRCFKHRERHEIALDWHKSNEMVAKSDKFQLMLIGLKDYIRQYIDIYGIVVEVTDSVNYFVGQLTQKLNFNQHA